MASKLRLARVANDFSQAKLAELSGVPQWRISLLERGISPKSEEGEAIAGALGLNAEKLFPKRNHDFVHTILSETEEGNATRSEG